MADDRANDPARVPDAESKYKSILGKDNIASVSLPSRRETTAGTGEWDFGGGRPHVVQYNKEELGPREMTKFDKNNKYHVGMLKSAGEGVDDSTEGMMMHSGGYFSFPKKEAPAKTEGKAATKKPAAPKPAAPKKDGAAPKKKMSNLEKARAAEESAKKSKKI
jgi:hypothetical protein